MYNFTAVHNFTLQQANFSLNASHIRPPLSSSAYWNARTIYIVTSKLIALFVNTYLVYLLARYPSVRTPFNVYVVNLCIPNMIYLWVYFPLSLVNEWLLYIAKPKAVCVFFRYLYFTLGGLVVNSHFLIAMNRLWAVTYPVSYRNYHRTNSLTRPMLVCLFMWLLLHAVNLPSVVIDASEPQSAAEYVQCKSSLSGPRWWVLPALLLFYTTPTILSVLVYPFILYKTLYGTRAKRAHVAPTVTLPTENTGHPVSQHNNTVSTTTTHATSDEPAENTNCWGRLQGRRGGQFMTLSLLTINVTFSLLPMQLFTLLLMFGIYLPSMFSIISIPYNLAWILDPALFLLTLKTLRDAAKKSLKWQN